MPKLQPKDVTPLQPTDFTPQEVAGQGTKRYKCPVHHGKNLSVAVGFIDGRVWPHRGHVRPRVLHEVGKW